VVPYDNFEIFKQQTFTMPKNQKSKSSEKKQSNPTIQPTIENFYPLVRTTKKRKINDSVRPQIQYSQVQIQQWVLGIPIDPVDPTSKSKLFNPHQ